VNENGEPWPDLSSGNLKVDGQKSRAPFPGLGNLLNRNG